MGRSWREEGRRGRRAAPTHITIAAAATGGPGGGRRDTCRRPGRRAGTGDPMVPSDPAKVTASLSFFFLFHFSLRQDLCLLVSP